MAEAKKYDINMAETKKYDINIPWSEWKIVDRLGSGSFGAVYQIERDFFDHKGKAALKVITIPQDDSDIDDLLSDGYDEESITERFNSYLKSIINEYAMMDEMKGCANIVYGEDVEYIQHDDGMGWDVFIRMELLTPLNKFLEGKNITDGQVVKIATDICSALDFCEKRNVIHRDIKPQNIFVSTDGTCKLGDFGVAKVAEHTVSGTIAGTYKYMAPEVYNNRPYGHKADIYSLGLVLYWLLNEKRLPFLPLPPKTTTVKEEDAARVKRFRGDSLPAPKNGSKALQEIVLKACAFKPEDRYASAAEMLKALNGLDKEAEIVTIVEDDDDEGTVGPFTLGKKDKTEPEIDEEADNPSTDGGTISVFGHGNERDQGSKADGGKGDSSLTKEERTSGRFKNWVKSKRKWLIFAGTIVLFSCILFPILNRNSSFEIKDGCLVSYHGDDEKVSIPQKVTAIGPRAFYECSNLVNVTIPDSVSSIGKESFMNCYKLTDITIPDSVTSIGDYAFHGCLNLENIAIPNSVSSIGSYAFQDCVSLTSINIPDSLNNIPDCAFKDCKRLTRVTIPNNVISIGPYAFYGCEKLTDITVPDSVISIGSYAFYGCGALTNLIIPSSVVSIGNSAFDACPHLITDTLAPSEVPTEVPVESEEYLDNREVHLRGDGQIDWVKANDNGNWQKWIYVYDNAGNFLYKKTNIGEVSCAISSDSFNGVKYKIPDSPIENCVGFTMSYEITNLFSGSGLGNRFIYVKDQFGEWAYAFEFDYAPSNGKVTNTFSFDEPTDIYAYAILRRATDVSNYYGSSKMFDIWVADYNY